MAALHHDVLRLHGIRSHSVLSFPTRPLFIHTLLWTAKFSRLWGSEGPHNLTDMSATAPNSTCRSVSCGPNCWTLLPQEDHHECSFSGCARELCVPTDSSWFWLPIFPIGWWPVHFGALDGRFCRQWIGREGPINWLPRSPELTPMNFVFWG